MKELVYTPVVRFTDSDEIILNPRRLDKSMIEEITGRRVDFADEIPLTIEEITKLKEINL